MRRQGSDEARDPSEITMLMIRQCYEHQHPEEYGRRPIHPPVMTVRPVVEVLWFGINRERLVPTDRGRTDHRPLPDEA